MTESPGSNRELIELMREARAATHSEIADLDRKFDTIPQQLDAIRKEQRDANDSLRREMQSYFVAKAEYVPHQQFVLTKFSEYDRIVSESRTQTPQWVRALQDIESLKTDQKEMKKGKAAILPNIITIVLFVIAVLSFIIQTLPHITIHP